MTTLPAIPAGLPAVPQKPLLTISFPRSTAATYAPAVEVARLARWYREEGEGRGLVHVAVFGRTPSSGRTLTRWPTWASEYDLDFYACFYIEIHLRCLYGY